MKEGPRPFSLQQQQQAGPFPPASGDLVTGTGSLHYSRRYGRRCPVVCRRCTGGHGSGAQAVTTGGCGKVSAGILPAGPSISKAVSEHRYKVISGSVTLHRPCL